MLPPQNRLRLTRDHRRATRLGIRGGTTRVIVHLLADPGRTRTPPQIGIVVSRAVGTAVNRNAVRRRLRHLMRARLDRVPSGSMVVIRAQAEAATVPTAALGEDLDQALDRALQADRRAAPRSARHGHGSVREGGAR